MMAWIVWNLGKAALGALFLWGGAWGLAELGYQDAWKAIAWVMSGDQPLVALLAFAVSRVVGGALYLLAGGDDM